MLWTFFCHAQTHRPFQDLCPNAQEIKINESQVKIRTQNRTEIFITLSPQGTWEEVKGVNLNRGDEFYPGQGMMSLHQISQRLHRLGKSIYGKWRLVKYQEFGWVYQVNAKAKKQPVFFMVNAYSGQLIGELAQLPPLKVNRQVAQD